MAAAESTGARWSPDFSTSWRSSSVGGSVIARRRTLDSIASRSVRSLVMSSAYRSRRKSDMRVASVVGALTASQPCSAWRISSQFA